MVARRFVCALACASCAIVTLSGTAPQTDKAASQPQMLAMTVVTVVPGMGAEYSDYQMKEVMPALRKGGSPGRDAFSTGVFGEAGVFAFFAPVADMAQFDGPGPMAKALGQEAAAALGLKGSKLVASRRVMLVRTRPDLGYQPTPGAEPSRLYVISEVQVAPGRRTEFEAIVKKEVVPAMRKAQVKAYHVLEVVYGGPAGSYTTAIGYDSYADIGKGHPFQIAFGEEGARKFEAKVAGIVTHVERFVTRHRPDLSFKAAGGTQ
jgi:hypothetical protein